MLSSPDQVHFVQKFSVWKTLAIEAALLLLAVLPLTPGFSEGLRYTAVFYQPPLNIILVVVCCFLGLLFIALLPLLWRAVRGLPAVEVLEDSVTVYGASDRSVARSRISHVSSPKLGNSTIQVAGERPLTLPVFLYRDASKSWQSLKTLLAEQS